MSDFHERVSKCSATVRNLSKIGARLMVTSPVGIPNEFELVLDRDRVARRCRVVWRKADRIGLEFE